MERRNRNKARILYDVIDASGFYHCPASENCRSSVSIVFDLPSKDLQAAFLDLATRRGLLHLAGHAASGGVRASLDNTATEEAAGSLAGFMNEFASQRKTTPHDLTISLIGQTSVV